MHGNYCSQVLVTVLSSEVLKTVKILLDFSSAFAMVNVKLSVSLKWDLNVESSSCLPFFSF